MKMWLVNCEFLRFFQFLFHWHPKSQNVLHELQTLNQLGVKVRTSSLPFVKHATLEVYESNLKTVSSILPRILFHWSLISIYINNEDLVILEQYKNCLFESNANCSLSRCYQRVKSSWLSSHRCAVQLHITFICSRESLSIKSFIHISREAIKL